MIALTALRDHLSGPEPAVAERIEEQYLVNKWRQGEQRQRLVPTQGDRESYTRLVERPGSQHGVDGVQEAYSFCTRQLRSDEGDTIALARRIELAIRDGLAIVEITAQTGDNVYRIFESLNNTGLRLSQTDLLRNYLFMRLPTRGEALYQDVWLPLQRLLSPKDLELLVWLHLVVDDERIKQSDIYRAEQSRLAALGDDEAAVEREVLALAHRGEHLAVILDPSRERHPGVRSGLSHLQDWGAQTSYPLLMKLFDLRQRGLTSSDAVAEALTSIESFLVRRMVCGVMTNNLNRVFNAAPQQVTGASDVAEQVRRYLSGHRRYWPTDQQLAHAVRTRSFYWSGRGPQRVHVLRRIERDYASSEPVDFAAAALTIEHVLPQTPTPAWLDLLEEEVTDEQDARELHASLVQTLGNLTLTGENSRLSNHPFQRKQDLLNASALRMNREIAAAPQWGKRQILERADRLTARMIGLWPGPLDASEGAQDSGGRDWTLLHRACTALPEGSWTSYSDLAELIGSHRVPVGQHLASRDVPNAWRVLTADGRVSDQFRWLEPDRADDPADLLRAEGVDLTDGRADQSQRVRVAELATLVGLDLDDAPPADTRSRDGQQEARFFAQLEEAHPNAVDAVADLIATWRTLGGNPGFGHADETSCFMTMESPRRGRPHIWPLALYPRAGTAEVVFQHMRIRSAFVDVEVRKALRDRLAAAGVEIPDAKLSLRPSFPLSILVDDETRAAVADALTWFAGTYLDHELDGAAAAAAT